MAHKHIANNNGNMRHAAAIGRSSNGVVSIGL
jgi:hypothetical protein